MFSWKNSLLVSALILVPPFLFAARQIEDLFPKTFVGCPEFETTAGKQAAGTAFLARRKDDRRVYLLTVRHLLGPSGGFRTLVSPDDVPAFVKRITLRRLFGGSTASYEARGLKVPAVANKKAPLYDLAIFEAKQAWSGDAALLADELPSVGETVWVVAHVKGGVPAGTVLHRATVVEVGNWLVCDFGNSDIVTNGASGAPVINNEGKVVGIYSGHSRWPGRVAAYAIPLPLIEQHLHPR